MKTVPLTLRLLTALIALGGSSTANASGLAATSSELMQVLEAQGVQSDAEQGFDQDGLPIICGTQPQGASGLASAKKKPPPDPPPPPPAVPSAMWIWECVPNAIRDDGVDTFRLEVNANHPVDKVILPASTLSWWIHYVDDPPQEEMRDDGLEGDRVAGDYVFTSSPITYNTNAVPTLYHYGFNTNGPEGVMIHPAGTPQIIELSGVTNVPHFKPNIGVLRSDIPSRERVELSGAVQVSDHLINVQTTNHYTQRSIRLYSDQHLLAQAVYTALPDAFDFLMCFSTEKMQHTNVNYSANFIAGIHVSAQDNYTGTGKAPFDNTSAYGSAGRLLGVNIIDAGTRGVQCNVITHELMHQWVAHTDPSFGLSTGTGHYVGSCNARSLVGGGEWLDNGDGTYFNNCFFQVDGAASAPPLDLYMMGLIPGSNVPPVVLASPVPSCFTIFTNTGLVTIQDLQAFYGVRTPAPPNSQTNFSLGFVAESNGRFLTDTEMTFYDIFAEHYTKTLPSGYADPLTSVDWPTITRYFGEDLSSWSSDVLPLLQPAITDLNVLPNGDVQLAATGYPGWDYELSKTTNFIDWTVVTNATASTNGSMLFTDSAAGGSAASFYRMAH